MLKIATRCLTLRRALVIWCALLVIAILNGALRVAWLIPRFGDTWGDIVSTVSLSAAIVLLAAYTIGWMRPRTWGEAWIIGACWLGLTSAFEFLGGHYLFGRPWDMLLADYNLSQGRIWIVVLVATAVEPVAAARTRLLFPHRPSSKEVVGAVPALLPAPRARHRASSRVVVNWQLAVFPDLTYGVQATQVMALGTATRRSVPMGRPQDEHVP